MFTVLFFQKENVSSENVVGNEKGVHALHLTGYGGIKSTVHKKRSLYTGRINVRTSRRWFQK